MRIEGSAGILPLRGAGRPVTVARLRDVSRAEIHPSRNRLIAATGRAPNAAAAAPARRLTADERALLASLDAAGSRQPAHGPAPTSSAALARTPAAAPEGAGPAPERAPPPPPSVPIRRVAPPDDAGRQAARAGFGAEVVQAYARAEAASAPATRFDILA